MASLTTGQAAEAVGISRATLQVWIATKTINAPKTRLVDGKAVRLWAESDVKRLRAVKEKIYRKGRGRKPSKKSL